MCLDVLALEQLQNQLSQKKYYNYDKYYNINDEEGVGVERDRFLCHEYFLLLQSHVKDFDIKDRKDWERYAKMFVQILKNSTWEGPIPTVPLIVDYISRILSNNFGIFILRTKHEPEQDIVKLSFLITQEESIQLKIEYQTNGVECSGYQALNSRKKKELRKKQIKQQKVAKRADDVKEQLTGRELHVVASFLNHSCEPNCVMVRQGNGLGKVTTLRTIKKGEELTISYIDTNVPRSTRRWNLKKFFFFDCECKKCEEEKPGRKQKQSRKQTLGKIQISNP
eukprot:TRINITY_DN10155_c0_g1_i1.p2 TRINITY_DN10155_c0_g1~~TRINITY_DN10155_c0_g1_i1.p2  ORF type:complete len:281 (-),score=33.29 TRINITY_DN10155_c0_g1_i1:555-1397(-)